MLFLKNSRQPYELVALEQYVTRANTAPTSSMERLHLHPLQCSGRPIIPAPGFQCKYLHHGRKTWWQTSRLIHDRKCICCMRETRIGARHVVWRAIPVIYACATRSGLLSIDIQAVPFLFVRYFQFTAEKPLQTEGTKRCVSHAAVMTGEPLRISMHMQHSHYSFSANILVFLFLRNVYRVKTKLAWQTHET